MRKSLFEHLAARGLQVRQHKQVEISQVTATALTCNYLYFQQMQFSYGIV